MFKKTLLLTSASLLIMGSSPVIASEKMSMDDIQAQLQQLADQVQNLSNVVEQQNETIKKQEAQLAAQKQISERTSDALASIQPAAGGQESDIKISFQPGPKIESADGKYSFQPFGRAHFDVTHFDDDRSDQDSNMNLRRARLGFKGKAGEDLDYKAEIDFAEEAVAIKSFYLNYSGIDGVDLKVGNHKPQFGLQNVTSSNNIQLIERSGPSNAFTRSEILGFAASSGGDNWSLSTGVFGEDPGNDDTGNDEDISLDLRGSANVLGLSNAETDNVLHVGTGLSHRRPTDAPRFRVRTTGDGPRAIDTGAIDDVDDINVYNLELAGVFGPLSLKTEYFETKVSRDNGASDADFDGYYIQAGYFLTGENLPYIGKSGSFGRVKPNNPFSLKNGEWGAWEVVARHENLDLNDAAAGIAGGELKSNTLGINWHLSNHVRMMGNIIDVNTDSNAVVADDDPTVYNLRTQWDF